MMTGAVEVEALTVSYGRVRALCDVGFRVDPGTLLAVTGPSGAGKSSLLWAIAGAVEPAGGTVRIGPVEVTGRAQAAALGVALVPQGNGLAAMLTATENITVPLLAHRVAPREAAERARTVLAAMGLEDSGGHLIEELSGGQQQRVAVARVLAQRPGVILADEPTSDVDSVNRERMISLLQHEAHRGAVVIMSTHDPEAAAAADGEIALDEGVMSWVRHPGRHPRVSVPRSGTNATPPRR